MYKVNYIKHLSGVFDRIEADERLNPTHVGMYFSLFKLWNIIYIHDFNTHFEILWQPTSLHEL